MTTYMPDTISFPNPPITEALLDIRVTLPEEITIETLEKLHEDIKNDYPTKRANMKGTFQIRIGESPTPEIQESSNVKNGYMFITSDGKKIIQARLDGFTFNCLKPYPGWDEFIGQARAYLGEYFKITKPISINRIALRYINSIEIPNPITDFKEYFLTTAEIAQGLPQALAEYFFRVVIPEPSTQNVAIVTQAIDVTRANEKIVPFIFDLDVFRQVSMEPNDDELFEVVESLRVYKNLIFLNSLTDKTKNLFQ